MSCYLYRRSEPTLWTVGIFTPRDEWIPHSDHPTKDEAAACVSYLNGGLSPELSDRLYELVVLTLTKGAFP